MRRLLFLRWRERSLGRPLQLARDALNLAFKAADTVVERVHLDIALGGVALKPGKAGLEVVDSFFAHGVDLDGVLIMVPGVGIEPTRLASADFESAASANSATRATGMESDSKASPLARPH